MSQENSKNKLRQEAIQIATQLQSNTNALKLQLAKIEEEKLLLNLRIEAADLTRDRAQTFRPVIDSVRQCPHCWIATGIQSALSPIGGGTNTEDFFRCSKCHFEYSEGTGIK